MMAGHFVYVPDETEPAADSIGMFSGMKDVNSVREVAEAWGVCEQTVRRLIASGALQSVRIGRSVRVTRGALIEFITNQEVFNG